MDCDLHQTAGTKDTADVYRYETLHPDGRSLIHDWYERAAARYSGAGENFEPFIFLWIAFNGWSACVTGLDHDRQWRDALIADRQINDDFGAILQDDESGLHTAVDRFATLWPIFRVEELRHKGIDYWEIAGEKRPAQVTWLLNEGASEFEPPCWPSHQQRGERPTDWAHTLSALYRVRCNLFHGEKARTSENDRIVVESACASLLAFLGAAAYLG